MAANNDGRNGQQRGLRRLITFVQDLSDLYRLLEAFCEQLGRLNLARAEAAAQEFRTSYRDLQSELNNVLVKLRDLERAARRVMYSVTCVIRRISVDDTYIQDLQAEIEAGTLDGRLRRYCRAIQRALARCVEDCESYEEAYRQTIVALRGLEVRSDEAGLDLAQAATSTKDKRENFFAVGAVLALGAVAVVAATWWYTLPLWYAGAAAVMGGGGAFVCGKNFKIHSNELANVQRAVQVLRDFGDRTMSAKSEIHDIDRRIHHIREGVAEIKAHMTALTDYQDMEIDTVMIQQDVAAVVSAGREFQASISVDRERQPAHP